MTPKGLELIDRRRAIDIGRHQQGVALFAAQLQSELAAGRGLARTLKAAQHDRDRRAGCQVEGVVASLAHERGQFVAHDLDNLLGRRQALEDFLPHGALAHRSHEILNHLEVDVRLKQHQTNLAQGLLDVVFGQVSFAAKLLKNTVEFFTQAVKHAL